MLQSGYNLWLQLEETKKFKICFLTVPLRRGCPPCTLLETTAL